MTTTANRTVTLCYFGSLSEHLGERSESLNLSHSITTLTELRQFLAERGNHWTKLRDKTILSAVNHSIVTGDCDVNPGDEIAFFPPVTGG